MGEGIYIRCMDKWWEEAGSVRFHTIEQTGGGQPRRKRSRCSKFYIYTCPPPPRSALASSDAEHSILHCAASCKPAAGGMGALLDHCCWVGL
jgi:hypothetical protein